MTFGTFISPDPTLETLADPNEKLGLPIFTGFRAVDQAHDFVGINRIFDGIWKRLRDTPLVCEDQCSGKYYYDLVSTLRDFNGAFSRVVEVGVYMGGASAVLAGCIGPFDFDLDLVDLNADFLRYSYERVRRMYPEAACRVRLFHGDLPSYIRNVMLDEAPLPTIIHHDAAHDFNGVVRDMAALSFVRYQIHAIIAQDTHLRGTLAHMNFVDMAMYAVFGLDMNYAPIGSSYAADNPITLPNEFQGNYFLPNQPEGVVLPMAVNRFVYPHPNMSITDFLPPATE
jgi:hypothetical protein